MNSMIAKTIYLASPAATSTELSTLDIVSIVSACIAVLAVVLAYFTLRQQHQHNIRMAKPHVEIDVGVNSHIVRLTNHGYGVAKIIEFTADNRERKFSFLSVPDLEMFCTWLASDLEGEPVKLDRNCLRQGSYLAPNSSIDIIFAKPEIEGEQALALMDKVTSVVFELHISSIYDKTYTETYAPST
jgi:hypothetical protein